MTNLTKLEARPIQFDSTPNGGFRIRGTRIPMERVVTAYRMGDTPEQIVDDYDTLTLADVHRVIAFYLDHRATIDAYLREQAEIADELQARIEAGMPSRRAEMQDRWAKREAANAPIGDGR
jgi:uncharacterized protein (DUF433 family)